MSKVMIEQFQAKACLSYLIVSEGEGILIDPHFSLVETYRKVLKGIKALVAIVDTHTHADHLSAAALLAEEYDVSVYMSENALTTFSTVSLKDGDDIVFGGERLTVIATPGHTDDSLCLRCQDNLFSGDTLLVGSIGRCDFQNGSPQEMHSSLAKLRDGLDGETVLYPGHSYTETKQSSLDEQSVTNPYFAVMEKEDFVAMVTAKTIPKPDDMERIVATNQQGSARELGVKSPQEVYSLLGKDDWQVIDVRSPEEFYSVSIEGTRNIPYQGFGSYIDELTALGKKLVLTCNSGARARAAAQQLMGTSISEMYLLDGSLLAWQKQKFPVIRNGPRYPLQQQVLLVAGSLVTIGILFSYLFSPMWQLFSLFVGCGQIMAGFTGFCPMANILLKMPWNKVEEKSSGSGCSLGGAGGGCSL